MDEQCFRLWDILPHFREENSTVFPPRWNNGSGYEESAIPSLHGCQASSPKGTVSLIHIFSSAGQDMSENSKYTLCQASEGNYCSFMDLGQKFVKLSKPQDKSVEVSLYSLHRSPNTIGSDSLCIPLHDLSS